MSKNMINLDVSSGLKFIADHQGKPEDDYSLVYKSSEKWFYIMTSRSLVNALSKINFEICNSGIEFLEGFVKIISQIEVGLKKIGNLPKQAF